MATETSLIVGGRLIDGTGRDPVDQAGVLIEDGRIAAVGQTDTLPRAPDARVIEAEGRTIMPALIDAHTHLTYHGDQPDVWQLEFQESVELNTLKAARNARMILEMGFATIGDGGCRSYIGPAVRDAIRQGVIPGPRVFAAGPILCGSAGLLDSMPAWIRLESDHALGMVVNGADEVRRAVRTQVKGGVDWIKVSASGVAGSRYATAETDDLSGDEIMAAVAEARKFGKPVHAHAHSLEGIRASVAAGVLSLHSGEFADEELLALMRDKGVIFSPTIAWLHARCLPGYKLAEDPAFVKEAWRAYAAARVSVVKARELGVRIAIGTDAAHRFHHAPDGVLEMAYLQALGYPALEVVTAATRTAAEAVNLGHEVGTLEPGKRADVLVVDGEVAEDVRVLRDKSNIWRMLKDGREVALPAGRGCVGADFDVASSLDRPPGAAGDVGPD
ncbi:MAG: amidohydrolase family protein [Geminicoccaceae bacterium]